MPFGGLQAPFLPGKQGGFVTSIYTYIVLFDVFSINKPPEALLFIGSNTGGTGLSNGFCLNFLTSQLEQVCKYYF